MEEVEWIMEEVEWIMEEVERIMELPEESMYEVAGCRVGTLHQTLLHTLHDGIPLPSGQNKIL